MKAQAAAGYGVPVLDIAPLAPNSSATSAERLAAAKALVEACSGVGSFYIVGHSVPADLLDGAFRTTREFFGRPEEEKMALHVSRTPPHRGYVRVQERKLGSAILLQSRSAEAGDLKENFDIGPDLPADDPVVRPGSPFYGPNVWPEEPADFRPVIEAYINALKETARSLFRGVAMGLGLPEEHFEANLARPLTRMKLNHYPPPPAEAEVPEGVGAHRDFSCFTLLAQDEIGGLEIFDKQGRAVPVPPLPGALFVNVGDQLARWSNDRFWSTVHRVLNVARRDRYSIAFFVHPGFDASLACLETEEAPKYPPIIAGEDLLQRLSGAYDVKREGVRH